MNTAEEVAKGFIQYWKDDFRLAPLADLLDAYAEERVKEAEREILRLREDREKIKRNRDAYQIQMIKARAEALEEAAKIAEGIGKNQIFTAHTAGIRIAVQDEIAEAIRALKEKP